MKLERILRVLGLPLTVMALALFACPVMAQEEEGDSGAEESEETDPGTGAQMSEADQVMMEAWMKAATPGPHHESFKKLVGKWDCVATVMHGPDGPASSNSTATFELILGGRFLVQRFNGVMMDSPFEGFGIDGYDNIAGEHFSLWGDNWSSSFVKFIGKCSDNCRTMEAVAHYDDPQGKECSMRTVIKWTDDDHFTMEMYQEPMTEAEIKERGPEEALTMTIKYSRAKAEAATKEGENEAEKKVEEKKDSVK